MLREEAIEVLQQDIPCEQDTDLIEAIDMAIEALSVEPCDCISFPKGTLKKRGKGYVVYDPEWLKENWQTELKVMGVECEDAISRQAAIDAAIDGADDWDGGYNPTREEYIKKAINALPPVTPKQKMGHWIEHKHNGISHLECSECSVWFLRAYLLRNSYCPNCGAKMSENPTGSNCTACIIDGTDACSRGAGRAVDGRVCEDFVGESED